MICGHAERNKSLSRKGATIHLEESLEPPDLEYTLSNQYTELEYRPPLDSCVCAFGSISVGSLSHDNVGLFVLDLC